ncbi:MarR family transcriptional regulator [Nisaea acidiphila]|uniref:MarR family transcriptional regulator n=1 Tax=Nisaea acidiphila TaxID=1862145 RepID=A0A9J7AQF5_9PROT|nr:MarR family transcriptional regulator [Nisaea acidiphila]UUX49632.1 MarR family transcriptional regulator [Nisaea acidiphila]
MNTKLLANHLGALATALGDRVSARVPGSESSRALLATLAHWEPVSATDLARIVGLSQPAATRALEKLRAEGLVDWPASGRTRPVNLTPHGREIAAAQEQARYDVLSDAISALSDNEQEVLETALINMLARLTESPAAARHLCRFCDHGLCDGPACPVGTRARALAGTEREAGAP